MARGPLALPSRDLSIDNAAMETLPAEGSPGVQGPMRRTVPGGAAPAVRARRPTGFWLGALSLALVVGGPVIAQLISTMPYPAQGTLEPLMFAGLLAVPVGMVLGIVALVVSTDPRQVGGADNSTNVGTWLGGLSALIGLGLIGFAVLLFLLVAGYLAGGM